VKTFQFSTVSQRILLVISLGYLAHILTNGLSTSWLQLLTATLLKEPWRVFTYPLGVTNGFEMFSFGFTFYFLSTYLERIFSSKKIIILFSSLLIAQAFIHYTFFHNPNIPLHGVTVFTSFTLAVISFTFPRIPVPIFGFFSLRLLHLSGILLAISLIPHLLSLMTNISSSILFQILTQHGLSLLSGVFVAFYTSYKRLALSVVSNQQYIQEQPYTPTKFQVFQETSQEESVFVSRYQLANSSERTAHPEEVTVDFVDDESRLNQILDKISIQGKDSLSEIEVKFLEDYSKKL
jgi:membrane associated rhomboid family serine protease